MTAYSIRHVTRFSYDYPVRFARCNLRLAPIEFDGQTLQRHKLEVQPTAEMHPIRPSGFPVKTMRAVVSSPATTLTIESDAWVTVDRIMPVAASDDPSVERHVRVAARVPAVRRVAT